jgi:hypothetical protein
MVRSVLQTRRYPSGSTRGEVERILKPRLGPPKRFAGRRWRSCLGRVTHAGQIDARLCVLALGARPGASLGHRDGRQDYDARRKSAAVIEIILLVAQEHDQRQSPVDRHGRWMPTEKPGRNADAPGLI